MTQRPSRFSKRCSGSSERLIKVEGWGATDFAGHSGDSNANGRRRPWAASAANHNDNSVLTEL